MKDYLKEPLTQEEHNLIIAVIWKTAKKTKERIVNNKYRKFVPIDDVDLASEDEYDFVKFETRGDFDFINVLTKETKERIVEYVDGVLIELSLYKFRVALTFDEKLVLFLCSFKSYSRKQSAFMLQVTTNRIKYLKESIKIKKEKFIGGIRNV